MHGVHGSQGSRGLALLVLLGVFTGCATTTYPATHFSSGSPVAPSPPHASPGGQTDQSVQRYSVPGRTPGSEMPWELFLGNAAHRLIAYMYKTNHPLNQTFYNKETIFTILTESRIGDASRLSRHEKNQRPDITDATILHVFEIKPRHDKGLAEGRQKVEAYLAALSRATSPSELFSRGTDFQGELLIRFARGQYIWRLDWQTTEPGVVQYRWTRSQERFESEAAAYQSGQWVGLTEHELRQYGGWVGQAVEGMVSRRERLSSFSGAVGIVIDIVGEMAVGVFSGQILGRMGSRPGTQKPPMQPPSQGGAKVLPLPSKAPPPAPPVRLPAASGM